MAIIASRIESVPVWTLDRAALLARAVGRISVSVGDGRSYGYATGFLVSPRSVLTCHHAVPGRDEAADGAIEFDYRDDASGAFGMVTRVRFDPDFVFTDAGLDCALLGLSEPVADRPCVPLNEAAAPEVGQKVTLIHHPEAGPQKIAFRDGEIVAVGEHVIHHTAGSMPGSAGGPLFDDRLRLIGLHHATVPPEIPGGAPLKNEAIRIDAIRRLLIERGISWVDHLFTANEDRKVVVSITSPQLPASAPTAGELVDTTAAQVRSQVFISYARDDQPEGQWRERLRTFLQPFSQQLDVWDDSRIQTGAQWRSEIDFALKRARVAILLIGPHFLASEFIAGNELPPLLEAAAQENVRILPLITNECSFSRSALGRYQSFNDPDQPLEGLERPHQNRVLRQFAERVFDVLGEQVKT
jgi:hypothetical protein